MSLALYFALVALALLCVLVVCALVVGHGGPGRY
jgi:hypothetical protein